MPAGTWHPQAGGRPFAAAQHDPRQLKNQPLPGNLIVFGELGLSGEVRLLEAAKHGFRRATAPDANQPKKPTG